MRTGYFDEDQAAEESNKDDQINPSRNRLHLLPHRQLLQTLVSMGAVGISQVCTISKCEVLPLVAFGLGMGTREKLPTLDDWLWSVWHKWATEQYHKLGCRLHGSGPKLSGAATKEWGGLDSCPAQASRSRTASWDKLACGLDRLEDHILDDGSIDWTQGIGFFAAALGTQPVPAMSPVHFACLAV